MSAKASATRSLWPVLAIALVGACADATGPAAPALEPDGRITVTNDRAALAGRVQVGRVPVAIETDGLTPGAPGLALGGPATSVKFDLIAQVAPPTINGQVLQASHVYLSGKYAYVSYMTQGETSLGAIEVFDVSDPDEPELVSQAILTGTDVGAVAVSGGYAYLATATSDSGFAERAVAERITLSHNLLTGTSTRIGIPSFFGTGVDTDGKTLYLTSGSGGPNVGGLTILDAKSLTPIGGEQLADARAVAVGKKFVVVAQGTPARLRIYDAKTGGFLRSVNLPGGTIPDSKSGVAVTDDWAFVATGDGGMQVVDLLAGTVRASLPRPSAGTGDPGDAVTNAVAISDDLILTADGGAGVHVAYSDYQKIKTGGTPTVTPLGRLGLPGSANFVAADDEFLFVADGSGGLKILEIEVDDD